MFGKNNSSSSNVSVNVTLDLSSPAFFGTTSVESLIISSTSDNKQIIFSQPNNYWYLNAASAYKMSLGFGTSFNNWNSSSFDFYNNGNFRCPSDVSGNRLIARNTLWFGDQDLGNGNTDDTYLQNNFITTLEETGYNASELAINIGDDGLNDAITLPVAEEPGNTDYVTVRSTNNGVHHAFSTTGNYYYATSLVPKYTNLPALTTLQIGGCEVLTFQNGLYLTGYNYVFAGIPIGYYLVFGHLEVTPDTSTNKYLEFGISTTNKLYNSEWSKYFSFYSTHKDTFNFTHYIANDAARDYYFIFNSNTEVEVSDSQCTFLRIA